MGKYQPKKFWNHYFILVILIYLLTMVVIRLLDNTLAIYAKTVADSESYGGNLTTFFTLGSIITALFSGRLIDRVKRRWILLAALVLFAVSVGLCAVADAPWQMYVLRVFQGVSKAAICVTTGAMAADVVPPERMGEGIGYYGFGTAISMAFGPLVGLLLVSDGNFTVLFCVAALLMTGGALLSLPLNYEGKGLVQPQAGDSAGKAQEKGLWKFVEKKALPASVVQFLSQAGSSTILVFAMLYASKELGLGTLPIALFYLMMALSMFLMRILSGRAVDRGEILKVAVISLGGAIIGYLMLGFLAPKSVVLYILSAGFYGLCHGGVAGAMNAQAVVASPPERKGAAMSTFNLMMDLGMFIASYVFGIILENSSYRVLFSGAALCAGAALALSVLFFRKKKKRGSVQQ